MVKPAKKKISEEKYGKNLNSSLQTTWLLVWTQKVYMVMVYKRLNLFQHFPHSMNVCGSIDICQVFTVMMGHAVSVVLLYFQSLIIFWGFVAKQSASIEFDWHGIFCLNRDSRQLASFRFRDRLYYYLLYFVCKLLSHKLMIGFSPNSYSHIRLIALWRDRRFPRDLWSCLDFGKAVQRSNRS